jgi:D-sedoheptulose 7-phosphate isomerase
MTGVESGAMTSPQKAMEKSALLAARVAGHFAESAKLKLDAASSLVGPLVRAGALMADALSQGGKVLACGNGGSAADAQHFAAEFVGRFERERPGLAAIALTVDTSILTAVGNDYGYEVIFAKQVEALGAPGDILLAMSTSGNSANVLAAIDAARAKEMTVIALTGNTGGKMREQLTETDVHICVPHERTARIQEVHLLVLHCLCDAVDLQLLGEEDNT